MKIIFDSSFLLESAQAGKSGFEEAEKLVEEHAELVVPKPILGELQSIASMRRGKKPLSAKLVLQMLEKLGGKVKVEKTAKQKGDDAIREIVFKASENQEFCVVCSNDYDLRKSLRKKARFLCVKASGKVAWC